MSRSNPGIAPVDGALLDAWRMLPYLARRGLLEPADCLLDPPAVETRRGRNLVFLTRRARGSLFVKQAVDRETRRGVDAELAIRDHLAATGGRVPVPRLLDRDLDRSVLVLEALSDHRPLSRVNDVPRVAWRALGAALRELHRLPAPGGRGRPPPIISVDRPGPGFLRHAGPDRIRLVRRIQRSPSWRRGLSALRSGWRVRSAVHGDLRLDNVLLDGGGDLRLVDWELSGPGDPAADLGWVVGDLLARGIARGEDPVDSAGPATREVWRAWTRGLPDVEASERSHASIRWAAARLLQVSFERVSDPEIGDPAVGPWMALGGEVMARPGRWAGRLLAEVGA